MQGTNKEDLEVILAKISNLERKIYDVSNKLEDIKYLVGKVIRRSETETTGLF